MYHGVFQEVYINFLIVGHTHDDIDALLTLTRHTNSQQFKFYRNANGWPLMQYKLLCTDNEWLPKEGEGIWL